MGASSWFGLDRDDAFFAGVMVAVGVFWLAAVVMIIAVSS
jgi:hypothetical protein